MVKGNTIVAIPGSYVAGVWEKHDRYVVATYNAVIRMLLATTVIVV